MDATWISRGGGIARCALLLPLLRVEVPDARDAWVEQDSDGYLIMVYTLGRGKISAIRRHEAHITDQADEFDSAYHVYCFRAPIGYEETLAVLATPEPVDPAGRWRQAKRRLSPAAQPLPA